MAGLAFGFAACGEGANQARQAPPPPPVLVAEVQAAPINPRIEYVGQTVAVDSVDLRARIDAFLTRRAFREGDDVREGALLFGLEREPFEVAVAAAQANVAEAQATLVRTRRDLERSRTLAGQGNLSQQSLDRATSDQQQAEATLRAREAALRQAQINLGYTQITAPFDGRIGRSAYSVGEWVGPQSGVLATLVKLDPIYVVFNVSERNYLDYRSGGKTGPQYVPRLRLSSGVDYPLAGRFNFVDNKVDPATGTIAVRAEFANPDKLLVPGLFVTVVLEGTAPRTALMIPQSAVQEDQGGRMVMIVDADNKVQPRRIETGARIGSQWEVTAGLTQGEHVIYEGLQKARPGGTVTPTLKTPAPASHAGSPPLSKAATGPAG